MILIVMKKIIMNNLKKRINLILNNNMKMMMPLRNKLMRNKNKIIIEVSLRSRSSFYKLMMINSQVHMSKMILNISQSKNLLLKETIDFKLKEINQLGISSTNLRFLLLLQFQDRTSLQ